MICISKGGGGDRTTCLRAHVSKRKKIQDNYIFSLDTLAGKSGSANFAFFPYTFTDLNEDKNDLDIWLTQKGTKQIYFFRCSVFLRKNTTKGLI